ncbi:MAG: argininosuccinate lyase [Candidatus Daviesbacteria bacterium]|nr:argininosuccinate lyase [Candidatus Daviesbacteria bacterium]
MKKLWQKNGNKLDPIVEAFETQGDLLLDQKLIKYDCLGSIAHAKMLNKIGILTSGELKKLLNGLAEILQLYEQGKFNMEMGDEDMHTKIENYLTGKYGEVGGKIHTGRSRNDQILTTVRLYCKDQLVSIEKELDILVGSFTKFSKKYGSIKMPGYTHMQKAMPSSIEIWAGSFIASLQDDVRVLKSAADLNNQSPLGSAAGYGVSLNLDKKYTAKLLGFAKVQDNPLYCQNSKGKIESHILSALIQILLTINKFASDVMLFTTTEFQYFKTSSSVRTGSSIMPQKKNLDLAELLRSKVHVILGNYTEIVSLASNLVSGYNRDLQDAKKPLLESLEIVFNSVKVTNILLNNLIPDKIALEASLTEELYATERALNLVKKGMSFRKAYKTIKAEDL